MHPEACAVDGLADPGQARQEEQCDRAEAEEVLVRLEHAVVVPQADQREREAATPITTQRPCLNASLGPRR